MSDEQQGEQQQEPGGDAGYEPGFLVPQSEEADRAAGYAEVMERHPELATDAAAANAAVASAAHLANYLEIPDRAGDPALVEIAHVLNTVTAAEPEPPAPPDPVDAILSGGKAGLGGNVLQGI